MGALSDSSPFALGQTMRPLERVCHCHLGRSASMRKEFGDDQVRITVRLPSALYHAILAARRTRVHWGNSLSDIVRNALQHALECPERDRLGEKPQEAPLYHAR